MKMKKTMTLGLLVFFVGLLMTACGSDESSPATSPTPTTTTDTATGTDTVTGLPTPTSTTQLPTQTCSSNCGQTQTIRIIVTNKEAFAEMVGLNTGTIGTGIDFFGNESPLGQIGNLFGNAALGCGLSWFESWLSSLGGGTSSGTCGGSTTTTTTNGYNNGAVQVQDSYNVTITPLAGNILTGAINLNNGQLYSFELRPNNNNSAWIAVNKNPPMGMLGNYQIFTSFGSGDVQVGYLAN